jgi:hypothetical protein
MWWCFFFMQKIASEKTLILRLYSIGHWEHPQNRARVFGALDHHTLVDLQKKNRSSSKWRFHLSIRGFFLETVKKASYRAD